MLNGINRGLCQMVYDSGNALLQFRSDVGEGVKKIAMHTIDFAGTTPDFAGGKDFIALQKNIDKYV